jgi:ankyrin repeat protein
MLISTNTGYDMPNSQHNLGSLTPFHVAIIKGRTEAVKNLLDHGADFSRPSPSVEYGTANPYRGYAAIHLAVRFGAADIVNLLLDRFVT